MARWALLVLVACDKTHAPPTVGSAAPAVAHVVVADAAVADLPAPWKQIAPPTDDQLMCANRGEPWAVSVDANGVHVEKQDPREPDTGPPVPFKPKKDELPEGRRHTLEVGDGFLVGTNAGEWGGSLDWFSRDGKKHANLGKPNVVGLVPLGSDEVLVLSGLNHLGIEEGTAQWFTHDAKGWHAGASAQLDGGPEALVDAGDAVYTVTPSSLVRIGRDRKVEVVASQQTGILYPDSMAVDAQHRLWIGMREFVAVVAPADRYRITWYASMPSACVK